MAWGKGKKKVMERVMEGVIEGVMEKVMEGVREGVRERAMVHDLIKKAERDSFSRKFVTSVSCHFTSRVKFIISQNTNYSTLVTHH